jgi:ribonucleotide reductase beta subunit family protein with ferritin-like domain
MEASVWKAEEIDLSADKGQFQALSPGERRFIGNTLGFFAFSDSMVSENCISNFAEEVQIPEAKCFYVLQAFVENIHNETYSLMIDTYYDDPIEKLDLLNAIHTLPAVQEKAAWMKRWCNLKHATFAERLTAFAAVEGIFFSASFCSIYWLKKRGLMPGLCFANELISRDEGLHCDFACLLQTKHLLGPTPAKRTLDIICDAVTIECNCVRTSLPVALIGMNASLMCQYVEFCGDRLLVALGLPRHYNVKNPFEWMETISLQGKTNFFEKRVGEYAKSGVGAPANTNHVFSLDEDF